MIPSRRKFVATLSVAAAALAIPQLGWAIGKKKKKAAKEEMKKSMIDMSKKDDPVVMQAAGLNYVSNVKEAIKAGKAKEKMGVKPENQMCKNCVLGKKEGDNYVCQLFNGVYVHETGWCTTWSKKA